MREQFDVGVIGSGFGGSLLAAILARQGQRVLLIDRGRHPRFAIGESSTPAADLLLQHLATRFDLPELLPLCRFGTWQATYPNIRCGCKRGFSYFWHGSPHGYQATAQHAHELLVAASADRAVADTQWYRADVDQFFCQLAVQSGVDFRDECRITAINSQAVESSGAGGRCVQADGDWQLQLDRNGETSTAVCRFLVDASGEAAVLLRHLQIPDERHLLRTDSSAVFSHFEQLPRVLEFCLAEQTQIDDFPFPPDDAAVHHLFPGGWVWQLRFDPEPTSLGFVMRGSASDLRKSTSEETWQACLQRYPVLARLLQGSRLAESPGKLLQTGRLQRWRRTCAGANWAALPSTAGFIDPLHSTGIAHTLSGVLRLAEILTTGNACPPRSERLAHFSEQVTDELRLIDQLVAGCYAGLDSFRRFTAWSMLYFAAATTFEQRFRSQSACDFLCASDPAWTAIVTRLTAQLLPFVPCGSETAAPFNGMQQRRTPDCITDAEFESIIRAAIQPFNHVGLFTPETPNMYHYTAADKSES